MLALAAPRRPRLPQLCFLVLAAFLMTNKVWSPQYVVWLVPLAVLARPRLWPYLLWQLAEVAYFFGIWGYLIFVYSAEGYQVTGYQGISTGWYFAALLARFLTVGLLAAYVVRDILDARTGRGACPRHRRPGRRRARPRRGPVPAPVQPRRPGAQHRPGRRGRISRAGAASAS